jgi:hypothetical protein
VPLSKIQTEILKLLASHRDPESYVAGSIPLNRTAARFSKDIDVFHDREERVREAVSKDAAALKAAGYEIKWIREQPLIYTAALKKGAENTRLEWVVDSDYRYFPIIPDEMFGYILHPLDLAMNKVMAAAGRRELRDIIDLVTIHEQVLPLGPVIWAAVEKAPGFTPEGLIAEIRRNSNYPREDWVEIASAEPLDPLVIMPKLRAALDEAEAFVMKMPTDKVGLLFLKDGEVVQPDPAHLDQYETHAGRRRGQWPSSAEISSAMLERYQQRPES